MTTSQQSVHQPGGLQLSNVSKTFPGQLALDDVSLHIEPGQVHALLGQNGSGKSTLVKILAGVYEPDAGAQLLVDDEMVELPYARDLPPDNLHFLHQDLGLVPNMSAVENFALGRGFATNRLHGIDWKVEQARATEQLARFEVDIDLSLPVSDLSAAERTVIAICRALQGWSDGWGLLVLDEPTAALPLHEAAVLYRAIRRVASSGASVLLITHRLDEVFELCDSVTILRDGRVTHRGPVSAVSHEQLVDLIVGKPAERFHRQTRTVSGEATLEVIGLRGATVQDINFSVRSGEVLGVAGLSGSGRDGIVPLLSQDAASTQGLMRVDGRAVPPDGPHASIRAGIATVPAERTVKGCIPADSVRENLDLPLLAPVRRGKGALAPIDRRIERSDVQRWIERVDVRPPAAEVPVATLSGGNQQKVVVAKWLRAKPRVLLLDEPTQGVDVGAKRQIYRLIAEAAAEGLSVVVASSDSEELAELCDRVIVMYDGRARRELSGGTLTPDEVTRACLGRDASIDKANQD